MQIISATEKDIPILNSLGISTYDISNIYGIYKDDTLVGFTEYIKVGRFLEIDNLHILKSFRGQGFGSKFLETLANENKSTVTFITGQSLPSAVGFWKEVGANFDDEINEDSIIEADEKGYCFSFSITI